MNMNSVSNYENILNTSAVSAVTPVTQPTPVESVANESAASKVTFSDTAAIYEKSEEASADTRVIKKDHSAIIEQLKADQEAREKQLMDIVAQTISQQGKVFGQSNDMWSFLAKGDFTVSPEVKAQAQADIAEDGYWGVEQTSDRILDFAKALAGDNVSKAEELLEAFKEGFSQATKTWGKDLPDISQKTYEAVEKKFNEWMGKSDEDSTTEATKTSTKTNAAKTEAAEKAETAKKTETAKTEAAEQVVVATQNEVSKKTAGAAVQAAAQTIA